jgi:hypothetical protein
MTHRVIDCLVNVHFGETDVQPAFMTRVREDYFKGPSRCSTRWISPNCSTRWTSRG